MRLLVLLLLCSFAHATSIPDSLLAGHITGGQIQVQGEGWTGSFLSDTAGTITTGGPLYQAVCGQCTVEQIHFDLGTNFAYHGLASDSGFVFDIGPNDLSVLGFRPVSFYDVLSGEFLTVTGQVVPDPFDCNCLSDNPLDGHYSTFSLPNKWNYSAHFLAANPEHTQFVVQDITITAVPELDTLILTLSGLGLISRLRRARVHP